MTYRSDIDGLRAVAVTLVLLFHAFPNLISDGFIGVDVFFVISGFLITGVIVDRKFSFGKFYARRARRLFPSFSIVIFASLAAGWLYLTPKQFEELGREAVASALFIPNFLFWSQAGYFDAAAASKPLLHLWSLGVEEQFYLAWPALLLVSRRHPLLILTMVTALSFAYCLYAGSHNETAAFYSPLARAWELGIGGLLFMSGWKFPRSSSIITPVGLIIIVATAVTDFSKPYLATVTASLGALLVIASGPSLFSEFALRNRVAVYLGKISYPVYLWHWPILVFFRLETGQPLTTIEAISAILASVFLAWLTYRLIEIPAKQNFSLGISASAATLVLAAALATGLFVVNLQGIPNRLPSALQEALTYEKYDYAIDAFNPGCWLSDRENGGDLLPICIKHGRSVVAVWGDSHAARLSAGLRLVFGPDRISQLTRNACPPILDFGEQACIEGNEYFLELIRIEHPATVILFGAWENYPLKWSGDSQGAAKLLETIKQIKQAGVRHVVLVGPSPKYELSLPSVLMRDWSAHRWSKIPERIKINRTMTENIDSDFSRISATAGINYVSSLKTFCDDTGCLTKAPGSESKLVTWDYGHLTTDGAKILAETIQLTVPLDSSAK